MWCGVLSVVMPFLLFRKEVRRTRGKPRCLAVYKKTRCVECVCHAPVGCAGMLYPCIHVRSSIWTCLLVHVCTHCTCTCVHVCMCACVHVCMCM